MASELDAKRWIARPDNAFDHLGESRYDDPPTEMLRHAINATRSKRYLVARAQALARFSCDQLLALWSKRRLLRIIENSRLVLQT